MCQLELIVIGSFSVITDVLEKLLLSLLRLIVEGATKARRSESLPTGVDSSQIVCFPVIDIRRAVLLLLAM